jgi:large subunit ribosomal protein L13
MKTTLTKPGSTTLMKPGTFTQQWHVVDADGQILGRLAARIAHVLRGRHKTIYTPNVDTGDFVIVLNAAKVRVTGKKETEKKYMFFSGWVGGESRRTVAHFREHRPEFLIKHAVKGMLPKNRIASLMLTKLKVYPGAKHPHEAQQPQPFPAGKA